MRYDLVLEGEITPDDAQRGRYRLLPFELPAGVCRLELVLHYTGMAPPNVDAPGSVQLDLGLYDPRGSDFLAPDGFRGWSGTSRRAIWIEPRRATPGYLPGSLPPGRWQALLGLSEVPCGTHYWLQVAAVVDALRPDPPEERPRTGPAPPRPERWPAPGPRWVPGDLHTHTHHSDGENTAEELVSASRARGLEYLAVTDHNTVSHHAELPELSARHGLPLIPGEEVTTYLGHANTWGLSELADFRCEDWEQLERLRRWLGERGALLSANHPKRDGPDWRFPEPETFRCMEVWQAPWRWRNEESLARWERLLAKGLRVAAVGGSDTHSVPPARPRHSHGPGQPTTWLFVKQEVTVSALLEAIAAGHAVITSEPNRQRLDVRGGDDGGLLPGDDAPRDVPLRLRCHVHGGGSHRLLVRSDRGVLAEHRVVGDDERVELVARPGDARYARVELRGFRGAPERGEVVAALANPFYFRS